MAYSMPTSGDAYNTLSDGDMSTIIGNGRATVDLTSRIAVGGESMPSARVGPTEFVGNVAVPPPPPTPSAPPAPPTIDRAEYKRILLSRVPAAQPLAGHPAMQMLLEKAAQQGVDPTIAAPHVAQLAHQLQFPPPPAAPSSAPPAPPAPAAPSPPATTHSQTPWWIPAAIALVFAGVLAVFAYHKGWLSLGRKAVATTPAAALPTPAASFSPAVRRVGAY